jgi:hypothetical protein
MFSPYVLPATFSYYPHPVFCPAGQAPSECFRKIGRRPGAQIIQEFDTRFIIKHMTMYRYNFDVIGPERLDHRINLIIEHDYIARYMSVIHRTGK